MQIIPLGDTALLLELGEKIDEATYQRVQSAWQALAAPALPGVVELVPAYTTITVFYDPMQVVQAGAPKDGVADWLSGSVQERLKNRSTGKVAKSRVVEIPVCYGGEYGPDLGVVAKHAGLSPEEIIKRHGAADYLVYLLGFAPGFPYLGGLPGELATPRHARPRMVVRPGSVGIADRQCGIYPLATPGGWNLIGRTPLRLFVPAENPPVLLRAGDRVKFHAIQPEEFSKLEASS